MTLLKYFTLFHLLFAFQFYKVKIDTKNVFSFSFLAIGQKEMKDLEKSGHLTLGCISMTRVRTPNISTDFYFW